MGNCGIKIVGRSRKLRINYRTTEETRRFATSVLENIAVDDLDGGEDSISGYRSLMHGEDPRILPFASLSDEVSEVAAKIRQLIDVGEAMQNIWVTARTKRLRDQFAQQLQQHGLDTWVLEQQNDNRNTPGIRLATMHRVKGLEFRYVFIVGVNEGVIPLNAATSGTEDPVEARQRDLNERALLHVAATRAIKGLFISYAGSPSPYLTHQPGGPSNPQRHAATGVRPHPGGNRP
ncbi:MAG: hypothetical protein HQL47_02215 [Gammaproteobacteria bacterium]|nr:hypothetical protein [Gammaproteobacteria bacterium]